MMLSQLRAWCNYKRAVIYISNSKEKMEINCEEWENVCLLHCLSGRAIRMATMSLLSSCWTNFVGRTPSRMAFDVLCFGWRQCNAELEVYSDGDGAFFVSLSFPLCLSVDFSINTHRDKNPTKKHNSMVWDYIWRHNNQTSESATADAYGISSVNVLPALNILRYL